MFFSNNFLLLDFIVDKDVYFEYIKRTKKWVAIATTQESIKWPPYSQYPKCRRKSCSIRKIQSRMCFQEKSPYTKDRPHEREGRESRDKQYPFIYVYILIKIFLVCFFHDFNTLSAMSESYFFRLKRIKFHHFSFARIKK